MVMKFQEGFSGHQHSWKWSKVINGQEQEIPGTFGYTWLFDRHLIKIEVEGSTYRFFIDGQEIIYLTDNTFDRGGIGLRSTRARVKMQSVEVRRLP